ncbi:hypothetical protein L7F22_007682 [Adiantum nelumboides]|nr:hypothetical protein [Adiantum nelumboides]
MPELCSMKETYRSIIGLKQSFNTSIHLMNMSPIEALTRLTPKEAYLGIKPNVSTLKVFGCVAAYMHILDEKRRKLDVKSERCVFTGYDMYSKGYRLVNPDTNKIHISRDVIFDESDKNTSSSYEEVSMEGENTTSQPQNSVMESTISHESAQDIAQEDASLQSINFATCPDSHIHEEDSTLKLRRSTRGSPRVDQAREMNDGPSFAFQWTWLILLQLQELLGHLGCPPSATVDE